MLKKIKSVKNAQTCAVNAIKFGLTLRPEYKRASKFRKWLKEKDPSFRDMPVVYVLMRACVYVRDDDL